MRMIVQYIMGAAIVMAAITVTGCLPDSKDDSVNPLHGSILTPAPMERCVNDLTSGKCYALTIEGVERYFYVVKPTNFNKENGMLLVLHGLGDSIDWQNAYFNATEVANRTGKILVFGKGTPLEGPTHNGKAAWNASAACCYFDKLVGREYVPDDVAYLERVIVLVSKEYSLNRKSTVLWGYSNGAFMSNRFACEKSELVSAIITQSGTMRADINECAPENPVSDFHIHGTLDQSIAYPGDTTDRDIFAIYKGIPGEYTRAFYSGAEEVTTRWILVNGCDQNPSIAETLEDFTTHDGVRYLNDYTTIPESELVVRRRAYLERYSSCKNGTTVQAVTIDHGTHRPVYDQSTYTSLITEFIYSYGTRTFEPVIDVPDRNHDDVSDGNAAVVPLDGADMNGAALVRTLGNNEYFARVGFHPLHGRSILFIRLLSTDDAVIGAVAGEEITKTARYGYATFVNVSGTPLKLQVAVSGEVITSPISWGNAPLTINTVLLGSGDRAAEVSVKTIGPTRLNFKVHISDEFNPSTIASIRLTSALKTIDLYPIPSGLPDPDDYDGEFSHWDIVKSGGFAFVENSEDGGYDMSGYADAMRGYPYYYEEMIGDPARYSVVISTETGDISAPMGEAPL